uniref:Retrovirus-related Pol polyprotein from transposon TNT 1-94 n=1 Tax=Tanacetum cinerariifolium TaxID=118510 RepID=A0A6L2NT34_TANCI|nr:hypothetical protein [Tanacetum cinerariifolium]
MENSKKGNLPLHHGIKISKDLCPVTNEEPDKMSRVPYALAIGSIMYVMPCTRPNVSFALSTVSRHQQNPGEGHWTAVKNILRYLRNNKDRFLVYGGEREFRGAVTWKSSKQNTVADSTCESEYIAACEASKEAIWMKDFIGNLGVVPIVQDPIEIFCDNESTVALTKKPKDHGKSKLIERKYHFVRSKVEEEHVIVKYIRSEDNLADPFTKALAKMFNAWIMRIIGQTDGFPCLEKVDLCICRISEAAELLSSSVEIISPQPSPFASLRRLKIYPAQVNERKKLKKINLSTVLNYLLDASPKADFTLLTRDDIIADMRTKAAKNLIFELQLHLEMVKADNEDNTNIAQVENQLHIEKNMAYIDNCWGDLRNRILHGIGKIEDIVYKLRCIEELLAKLPASYRAEIQPCVF